MRPTLFIASDHTALELKQAIIAQLPEMNVSYCDLGTHSTDRVDYPVYASRAAMAVRENPGARALLICGTGVGMAIAANKHSGIRAVVCSDCYSAKLSKQHNNTNVLALGARVVGVDLAVLILEHWLLATYQGERHQRRLDQISEFEESCGLY